MDLAFLSRQAVHETLARAAAKLNELESTLGVAARFRRMEDGLEAALAALDQQDYLRAGQLLQALLNMDQEENNGL